MESSAANIEYILDNFGDKLLAHQLTYVKKFQKNNPASTLTRFEMNLDSVNNMAINIDMYNDCAEIKKDEKCIVKVMLLASCAAELYKNEAEYYDDGHGLDAESILACGAFNPSGKKNFEQKPAIIARGTVLACEDFSLQTEQYYLVTLQIRGALFSVIVEKDVLPFSPQAGNVLSDLFDVAGVYVE